MDIKTEQEAAKKNYEKIIKTKYLPRLARKTILSISKSQSNTNSEAIAFI